MKALLVALVGLLVLGTAMPSLSGPSTASTPEPDYPGKTLVITEMEDAFQENTTYGDWTLSANSTSGPGIIAYRTFLYPGALGSTYASVCYLHDSDASPHVTRMTYAFQGNVSGERAYRLHTLSLYYRLNTTNESAVDAWVITEHLDGNGTLLSVDEDLVLDLASAWTYLEREIHDPGAEQVRVSFVMIVTGEADVWLRIDHVCCIAPPCSVRFSFYNYYTGLGLISELLIPEVWHNGTWYRVWNNEVEIAAGESISYRVTDYFDQVVTWTPSLHLNGTIIYLDIPVKLVKVHIAKPDWWTSNLPPEWQLTYMPSGVSVAATGWEVELIAGWYRFSWDDQKVTNSISQLTGDDEELIVENGTVDQHIEGSLPHSRAYTMSDFFLSLQPTIAGNVSIGTVIEPSLTSWEGLMEVAKQALSLFESSLLFKVLLVVGALFTLWTVVVWLRRRAKEIKSGQPVRRDL